MRSDTQTVTISATPRDVVAFVGNAENLPRWGDRVRQGRTPRR
jgi:hypothetical protein